MDSNERALFGEITKRVIEQLQAERREALGERYMSTGQMVANYGECWYRCPHESGCDCARCEQWHSDVRRWDESHGGAS